MTPTTRCGRSNDITIDDDFEAFCVALEANSLVDMRVSVVPSNAVSQTTPIPSISPTLPEMPLPTKTRKRSAREALVAATESTANAIATIPMDKHAGTIHEKLVEAAAPAQTLIPLPASKRTLTDRQAPKLKSKSKKKVQPISRT
jgi:hypothetical protein